MRKAGYSALVPHGLKNKNKNSTRGCKEKLCNPHKKENKTVDDRKIQKRKELDTNLSKNYRYDEN